MDPLVKIYLERAENELILSETLFKISSDSSLQNEILRIDNSITFYSAVISHAYYCIFYCAKAYLISKEIKTRVPEEHRKTFVEFSRFVKGGILDEELLKIYENVLTKAESLLDIFKREKKKRGQFTYQKLPQANKQPAFESLNNSKKFFKSIYNILNL
ncbi:MAG: HEPN domain-containing protein [Nanoarchaeota archaeon]|nr:HEPN domain-containing protein [Nanoarchaeota archaeon]